MAYIVAHFLWIPFYTTQILSWQHSAIGFIVIFTFHLGSLLSRSKRVLNYHKYTDLGMNHPFGPHWVPERKRDERVRLRFNPKHQTRERCEWRAMHAYRVSIGQWHLSIFQTLSVSIKTAFFLLLIRLSSLCGTRNEGHDAIHKLSERIMCVRARRTYGCDGCSHTHVCVCVSSASLRIKYWWVKVICIQYFWYCFFFLLGSPSLLLLFFASRIASIRNEKFSANVKL